MTVRPGVNCGWELIRPKSKFGGVLNIIFVSSFGGRVVTLLQYTFICLDCVHLLELGLFSCSFPCPASIIMPAWRRKSIPNMQVAWRLRTNIKFATCSEPRICTLACAVVVMCSSWPFAARRFGILQFAGALRYCFRTGSSLSLQRETKSRCRLKL